MSKNEKAGNKRSPNRPRSRNNPDGERNGSQLSGPNATRAAGSRAGTTVVDEETKEECAVE